jgi:hypothetical protein
MPESAGIDKPSQRGKPGALFFLCRIGKLFGPTVVSDGLSANPETDRPDAVAGGCHRVYRNGVRRGGVRRVFTCIEKYSLIIMSVAP